MKLTPDLWDDLYTYLVYDKKHDDSKKNVQRRKSIFLILCRHFSDKEFNRVNFSRFVQELLEKGYKKEYANTFIKLAKHIDKYYQVNQLADFSFFPRQPKLIDTLSYEQIIEMAEVKIPYHRHLEETNLKYKCLIYTLLLTGARISEVLNLTWENVKYDPACLILEQNKTNDIRIAPVSKTLLDMLNKLPKNSGFIFSSPEGMRLDNTTINCDLKRRAEAVGIKKRVYNHLIRHSFVNFMLRSGTPIHVVSRMVGHKDIATTNEYYTHIMVDEMANYLFMYHPHLRSEQTIDIIKNRIETFLQTFVNKEKFMITLQNREGGISIDIIENNTYKRPPLEIPLPVQEAQINTPRPNPAKKIKGKVIKKKDKLHSVNEYNLLSCTLCGNPLTNKNKGLCDTCEVSRERIDYNSFAGEKVG